MDTEPAAQHVALNLGVTSLVVGITGLVFFSLPVLGLPLSLFGLGLGVLGSVIGIFANGPSLRWGLGGTGVSFLALAVQLAIANAPGANLPGTTIPKTWQPPPGTPFVPPPAS
jgi:hypothetical protein